MQRNVKAIAIVLSALLIFAGLIWTKIYLSRRWEQKAYSAPVEKLHMANIDSLQAAIRSDFLYKVKDVFFRDSALLIAVENPEKSGTEIYFDRKYSINGFDNINMVFIYKYDSLHPLAAVSFEDALMAKGKRLGRFQDQWVSRYMNSKDGSCRPLKRYIMERMRDSSTFVNEETTYQPASINKMQVICKYRSKDSTGTKVLNIMTATVGADGTIITAEKNQ